MTAVAGVRLHAGHHEQHDTGATPAPAPAPPAATVAPATSATPAATGGGDAVEAQLRAALSELIAVLRQIVTALSSTAGGGATADAMTGGMHAGHGSRPAGIHAHYAGSMSADGMYHEKRTSYDPARRAIIVNKTQDVTKMLLPRTQPEDRAKAAAFLAEVKAQAPRTIEEAMAMGYRPKDGNPDAGHWTHPTFGKDKVTGDPSKPELLMVKNGQVTGVVFTSWGPVGDYSDLPDFGLGGWHIHPHVHASVFDPNDYMAINKTRMQHVMFEEDLDMAFMDGQYMGDHAH